MVEVAESATRQGVPPAASGYRVPPATVAEMAAPPAETQGDELPDPDEEDDGRPKEDVLRSAVGATEALRVALTALEAMVAPLPSLDLRPTLALFAPEECTFRIAHGSKEADEAGGQIEVIHRESKKVVELMRRTEELRELEQESRLRAMQFEVQAQKDRSALEEQKAQNITDRDLLTAEIAKMKDKMGKVDEKQMGKQKTQISSLNTKLVETEQKLQQAKQAQAKLARVEVRGAEREGEGVFSRILLRTAFPSLPLMLRPSARGSSTSSRARSARSRRSRPRRRCCSSRWKRRRPCRRSSRTGCRPRRTRRCA